MTGPAALRQVVAWFAAVALALSVVGIHGLAATALLRARGRLRCEWPWAHPAAP
jgi:hypothetical protein